MTTQPKKNQWRQYLIAIILLFTLIVILLNRNAYVKELGILGIVKVYFEQFEKSVNEASESIQGLPSQTDSLEIYKTKLEKLKNDLDFFKKKMQNFEDKSSSEQNAIINELENFINKNSSEPDKIISFGKARRTSPESIEPNSKIDSIMNVNRQLTENLKNKIRLNKLKNDNNEDERLNNYKQRIEELENTLRKYNEQIAENRKEINMLREAEKQRIKVVSEEIDYVIDNFKFYMLNVLEKNGLTKKTILGNRPKGFGIEFNMNKNKNKTNLGIEIKDTGKYLIEIFELDPNSITSNNVKGKIWNSEFEYSFESKKNIRFKKEIKTDVIKKNVPYKIKITLDGQTLGDKTTTY
jgi:hypothetical protein